MKEALEVVRDLDRLGSVQFADSNGNVGGGNCIVLMMPPVSFLLAP